MLHLIFKDYRPSRKCGAAAVAVPAVMSAAGSVISAQSSADNVRNQLSSQRRENQLNRDWQTAEAEKARQFNAQQASLARQEGLQNDLTLMNQQAQYQSPVYQRQQLEQAGINPQVYFGQNSTFAGSSAPAMSPSAPSSPMPSSVGGLNPVSFQPFQLDTSILSNLGSYVKNVADAKKTDKDASWVDDLARAELRKLTSESSLNDVLTVLNQVNQQLANAKLPYSLEMARLEMEKAFADVDLTKQLTLTSESQAKVNHALEHLQDELSKLTAKQIEHLGFENIFALRLLQAKLDNLNASTSDLTSHSKVNQSQSENIISQTQLNEIEKKIRSNELKVSDFNLSDAQLEYLRKQAVIDKINDSWVFRNTDGFINWLGSAFLGSMFRGLLK